MKSLILLITFSLSFANAFSQEAKKEVYPEQASIEHNDAVKQFSQDFVSAFSGSSSLNLFDYSANVAMTNVWGSENLTILTQQGYGIVGGINVLGDQNRSTLNQSGSELMSILNIKGNYNQFDMTQEGTNLQNLVYILGSGSHFDALHTNAGFQLNQHGVGAIPLSIQHTGQTVPIIIENN